MVNLKQLIAETFSVDASVIADDLKYQGIPQWDSVGHMNLIAALEDAFDLMLDMDDVIGMNSIAVCKNILKKYICFMIILYKAKSDWCYKTMRI